MDLEAYALTHQERDKMAAAIQGPQQASAAGDAGAADVKGKGRARKDDQPGSSAAANARDEVTFEKDVRFLAQNVSSWWNEFSRKVSK